MGRLLGTELLETAIAESYYLPNKLLLTQFITLCQSSRYREEKVPLGVGRQGSIGAVTPSKPTQKNTNIQRVTNIPAYNSKDNKRNAKKVSTYKRTFNNESV